MYKNLLPLLCLLLTTVPNIHSVLAQDGGIQYQYKDFRFPDIDRKALIGSLNMINNGSNSTTYLSGETYKFRNSQFSNNLTLDYSRFRNLEKVQAIESLIFNQRYASQERSSNSTNLVHTNSGSFMALPRYEGEYRYYYIPNRFWGYELDANAEYRYTYSHDRIAQQSLNNNSLEINVFPTLLVGWGRLEPIDDVFLAKFMVDDMKEAGMLNQDLSQEELFALGSTMAFVRNQRNFDFRRQRIYELTEIDRWFTESGIISNQDFRYFTVLNDNWLSAFRNSRFSGKRTFIGLTPSVQWEDTMLGDFNRRSADLGLTLRLNYQIHNPINQYWQSISEISAGVSYFCPSCGQGNQNLFTPNVRASKEYGYYPNSRTRVNAGGFINYTPVLHNQADQLTSTHGLSAGINFSADYFINFQFRVRANLGYAFDLTHRTSEIINLINYTKAGMGLQSNITFVYAFF